MSKTADSSCALGGVSLRVAIASSGLGHVSRGIETWAADLASALHSRGVPATLFKAHGPSLNGHDVTVPCWKRSDNKTLLLLKLTRRAGWRIGLGSPYSIEQTSFALRLLPYLRSRRIDILHVQDPQVAAVIQRAHRLGLVKTRVILAHGTEEPLAFLQRFTYLQHLAPWHMEEAKAAGIHKPTWTVIPNFIDTETFSPAHIQSGELRTQNSLRQELRIPPTAPVILSVAAIKRSHKRIDYLLNEFAEILDHVPAAHLVIAGGQENDTDELIRKGTERLGALVHFLVRFPRERIPNLYRVADIFALCSLKEMMPIALIEAAASGLPCITHAHPVMQWMTGPGGIVTDMAAPGQLAAALVTILNHPARLRELGTAARQHCLENFGPDHVLEQILNYYKFVLTDPHPANFSIQTEAQTSEDPVVI